MSIPQPPSGRWGTVNLGVGSRTPWGPAQYVEHVADGIAFASCAQHGGAKLSRERNALIPEPLRQKGGWYEEDCEIEIVALQYPEAFAVRGKNTVDEIRYSAAQSVKASFPDEWLDVTGEQVSADESFTLRERERVRHEEEHRENFADAFVPTHTVARWERDGWVPQRYAAVRVEVPNTGEQRDLLMPHEDCYRDNVLVKNAVVDPDKYLDVTGIHEIGAGSPKEVLPILYGDELGISYEGLTHAQQQRAYSELNKRWRFASLNNEVMSLAEYFETRGVVGKQAQQLGGQKSLTYSIYLDNESHIQRVSKATFAALTGVPDKTTEEDLLGPKITRLEDQLEQVRWLPSTQHKAAKIQDRITALEDKRVSLRGERQRAAGVLPPAERAVRKRDEFRRRLAEHCSLDISPDNEPAWAWMSEHGIDPLRGDVDDSMRAIIGATFPNP